MREYNNNLLPNEAGAAILGWVTAYEETQLKVRQVIERKAKRYVTQKQKLEQTPASAPARKYLEAELRELRQDITDLDEAQKAGKEMIESMAISLYMDYAAMVEFKNDAINEITQAYEFTHGLATSLLSEKAEKKTDYPNRLKAAA